MTRWIITTRTIPMGTVMYWKGRRGGWSVHRSDAFKYKVQNTALRSAARIYYDERSITRPEVVEIKI